MSANSKSLFGTADPLFIITDTASIDIISPSISVLRNGDFDVLSAFQLQNVLNLLNVSLQILRSDGSFRFHCVAEQTNTQGVVSFTCSGESYKLGDQDTTEFRAASQGSLKDVEMRTISHNSLLAMPSPEIVIVAPMHASSVHVVLFVGLHTIQGELLPWVCLMSQANGLTKCRVRIILCD